MANPNINSATTVQADNSLVNLTTTSATLVVSNAASSGKIYLLDSIVVSNVDGTNNAEITIELYPAASNTGTPAKLVNTVAVPADSSIVVVAKDMGVCLKEDQSIYATASAANDLDVVACWKEIS